MLKRKPEYDWREHKAVKDTRAKVERLRADLEAEGEALAQLTAQTAEAKKTAHAASVEAMLANDETGAVKARKAAKAASAALDEKQERIELLQATLTRAEALAAEAEAKAKADAAAAAKAAVDKQLSGILDKAVALQNDLAELCGCDAFRFVHGPVRNATESMAYNVGFNIDLLQTTP